MTAMTLAKIEKDNADINDITAKNIQKVTRFRPGGEEDLRALARKMKGLDLTQKAADA